jgi:hypothetical protein
MRRVALLVALLGALAVAAPAFATPPGVHKTAIGQENPIGVSATLTSPVNLFGDPMTARVVVVADTKWVSPARIRLVTDFAPFTQIKPPTIVRRTDGRLFEETWTWSLHCVDVACVPTVPPSDLYHFFHLAPARVRVLGAHGAIKQRYHARFPTVEELSQISPGTVAYLTTNKTINWQYQLATAAARPFHVAPVLVFWLAIVIAALLGAAGLAVLGRWALSFRAAAQVAAPALPASYLERALALFFWANEHGDETLQRKALERVADELPLDVIDLSDAARELAWSPERPEEDEVEAISERAGVPAHHEDGVSG